MVVDIMAIHHMVVFTRGFVFAWTVLVRARCWRRNHAGGTATVGGHAADTVAKSTACVHERHRVPGRLQGRK